MMESVSPVLNWEVCDDRDREREKERAEEENPNQKIQICKNGKNRNTWVGNVGNKLLILHLTRLESWLN